MGTRNDAPLRLTDFRDLAAGHVTRPVRYFVAGGSGGERTPTTTASASASTSAYNYAHAHDHDHDRHRLRPRTPAPAGIDRAAVRP